MIDHNPPVGPHLDVTAVLALEPNQVVRAVAVISDQPIYGADGIEIGGFGMPSQSSWRAGRPPSTSRARSSSPRGVLRSATFWLISKRTAGTPVSYRLKQRKWWSEVFT
jgi:hypothetical protein